MAGICQVIKDAMVAVVSGHFLFDEDEDLEEMLNILEKVENYAEVTIPQFNSKQFQRRFRVSPTTFEDLLQKLSRVIHHFPSPGRAEISLEKQGMITLWCLSNMESFRTSFTSYIPEHTTNTASSSSKEYRPYVRSASVLNDYVNIPSAHQSLTHSYQNVPGSHQSLLGSYQNLPGSYQTYSSRIARPSSVTKGLYNDSDNHLDITLTSSIPRRPYNSRSTLERGSASSIGEQYFTERGSSLLRSPTTSEPV